MLDLANTVVNKIENLRSELHVLDAKIEPMKILECSNLCLVTSDLNTRIKDLERERDSLVTALKLQQQDLEQNQHNNITHSGKWQTKIASRRPKNYS